MARVPQLSAQCDPTVKADATDFLSKAQVLAVHDVLRFFNREYGLLLGHIGRHLTLGRNTDLIAHLNRHKLPVRVSIELVALFGVNSLTSFLNLPKDSPSEQTKAVAHLKELGLIGKGTNRKSPRRPFMTYRDSYLDT